MKVLVVGNGAREQAIAEAFSRSTHKPEIIVFSSLMNPGLRELSSRMKTAPLDDFEALKEFVNEEKPDIAFIGPEGPLNAGIVDFLEEQGIKCASPKKNLAMVETSKAFTRGLMQEHGIGGLPKFKVFSEDKGVAEFITELNDEGLGFVVKPDGLAGGKGVKVSGEHLKSVDEGIEYALKIISSKQKVVIEEKLEGEEFSLQCLTDGVSVLPMPLAQDHKRAFEDDSGPNTGGMGSYSCRDHLLPFIDKESYEAALEITKKVVKALGENMGEPYKGVIYGGFMRTARGVMLLEYNARFGDPEAMNVLPILKNDFLDVCTAIIEQKLDTINLEFEEKATVCKYAVPEGYPVNPVRGAKVEIFSTGEAGIYYGSVEEKDDGLYMTGSRAIACLGIADSLEEAEQIAETGIKGIKGDIYHRTDIGTRRLIEKRISHMNSLLSREESEEEQ